MSETTLIPKLVVADADAAMAFYREAFGATEIGCHRGGDGHVVHADLAIDGARFSLKETDRYDPPNTSLLALDVPDSDRVFARAVAAGAEVIFPLATWFHGERGGRVRDRFGNQWMISTVVEVLSEEEMARRMAAYTG